MLIIVSEIFDTNFALFTLSIVLVIVSANYIHGVSGADDSKPRLEVVDLARAVLNKPPTFCM